MFTTVQKTAEDWTKFRPKNAQYAHISKDKIFVGMVKKHDGARLEYTLEFPNDNFIDITCWGEEANRFYITGGIIGFLKDITHIQHYSDNQTERREELGIKFDTVYLSTKKGVITGHVIKVDGKQVGSPDVMAMYH